MNEKISENGVIEDKNEFLFSWRKLCSWISFALSCLIPLAALGLAIMSVSNASEDEKEEVTLICVLSMFVSIIIMVNDLSLTAVL